MGDKYGGPAFPRTGVGNAGHSYDVPPQDGMSIRDYFAGQALAGIMANIQFLENIRKGFGSTLPHIPEAAYEMADAMLAEREK